MIGSRLTYYLFFAGTGAVMAMLAYQLVKTIGT
jgi:hypothetical protein